MKWIVKGLVDERYTILTELDEKKAELVFVLPRSMYYWIVSGPPWRIKILKKILIELLEGGWDIFVAKTFLKVPQERSKEAAKYL